MQSKTAARIGAACGFVFPVALSVGRSSGLPLGLAGLVLFVPFLAYICSLLRRVEGDDGWLTQAAFGAGLMGMTIKVMSGVPEVAYHGNPAGTQAHRALEGMANAATVVSLYPFAAVHRHRRRAGAAHRRAPALAGCVRGRHGNRAGGQRQLHPCRDRPGAAPVRRVVVRGRRHPVPARDVARPCHRPSAGCGELRASERTKRGLTPFGARRRPATGWPAPPRRSPCPAPARTRPRRARRRSSRWPR